MAPTARRRGDAGDDGRGAAAAATAPAAPAVRRWGPADILSAPENRATVSKLARFMAAVALCPPAAFAVARRLQSPAARYRDAISAVAAVLVLNAILVAYVYSAFAEPDPDAEKRAPAPRVGIWKERRAE